MTEQSHSPTEATGDDVRGAVQYLREEMLDAEEEGEATVRVRCDQLRTAIATLSPNGVERDHFKMVSGGDGPWRCVKCGAIDPPRPKYEGNGAEKPAITSRELIERCGQDPDEPLGKIDFPPEMRMRPATDEEAQRGLNDTWPGDPIPNGVSQSAVERLRYFVNNPSAWENYDESVSEAIRASLATQPASDTGLRGALEIGDAGDALDWGLDHFRTGDLNDFLEAWREGDLDEYPDYLAWVAHQQKCAAEPRTTLETTSDDGGSNEQAS